MSAESQTGSRPAPRAARSLCISRSESTTTPEASARGFSVSWTTPGPWTGASFLRNRRPEEEDRGVCEIRHFLTPNQHKQAKSPDTKPGLFSLVGCRGSMHGQQPACSALEDARRPAHRARSGLTDLRKGVPGRAPGPGAQVEQRLEMFRGLETRRIANLHAWRQRSKGVLPERFCHGLPLGLESAGDLCRRHSDFCATPDYSL